MATHNFTRKPAAAPWGSRIVGHGMVRVSDLLFNPQNFRTHGPVQEGQLSSVLHDVGFVQGVIINKRTSPRWGQHRGEEALIDGHLRAKAALSARGDDYELPATYVDLEPEEERRVLATFDPIGALAGADTDVLTELAEEVRLEWAESDLDLDAILKRERKKTKGLAHEVKECTCCKAGCSPSCGCYREAESQEVASVAEAGKGTVRRGDEAGDRGDTGVGPGDGERAVGHRYPKRHAGKPPARRRSA